MGLFSIFWSGSVSVFPDCDCRIACGRRQPVFASAPLQLRPPRFALRLRRGRATRSPKGEAWWARQDSNLQPDRYERPALTIELQAPREPVGPVVPDRLQGGPLRCNGGLGPIQAFCEQDEGLGYLVAAMHRWREPLAGASCAPIPRPSFAKRPRIATFRRDDRHKISAPRCRTDGLKGVLRCKPVLRTRQANPRGHSATRHAKRQRHHRQIVASNF